MKILFIGLGYTARALAPRLKARGAHIMATTRSVETRDGWSDDRVDEGFVFPGDDMAPALDRATHVVISAGPQDGVDPTLARLREDFIRNAGHLTWVGYLSTTGVYGGHDGEWVDEDTPLDPGTQRGKDRVAAEAEWTALYTQYGLPLHIFRLAGIYGPGRGPFSKVRSGKARRIIKPGQVFSRIHVDDIATVLEASIARPVPGAIYNVCDDEPAPPQDVIAHAADLIGAPSPPEVSFEEAEMSAMARSFYAESKRVSNARIKSDLGVTLAYPTYREGLAALAAAETQK